MAIAEDAPKNTASRMLGWMRRYIKKHLQHISLLFPQDTDVRDGTIYKASGWIVANKVKVLLGQIKSVKEIKNNL